VDNIVETNSKVMREPLWDRTLRRIQSIWPLGEANAVKNAFSPDLPKSDLPRLRKIIDRCLEEKGGEVSARTRAAELGKAYSVLSEKGRRRFLELLAVEYDVDNDKVEEAIERRREADTPEMLQQETAALRNLLEPPRTKLLRQFNELEEGVKFLVDLRLELIRWAKDDSRLKALDSDVFRLLDSWFDVGFLDLQQITWKTSAAILEKLIEYEAVHKIDSWEELKHRLEEDRLCYAFFHSRMPDEPLIFVEVALVNGMSGNIQELLDVDAPSHDPGKVDTAIFYSISNCQKGLAGVSFGNFLIKRVVAHMAARMPKLNRFSTLSPIPGFMKWLRQQHNSHDLGRYDESVMDVILQKNMDSLTFRKILSNEASVISRSTHKELKSVILDLCAHYLVNVKKGKQAHDRVANFHLTNGARIERINWAADLSENGLEQSDGVMVNYLYDLPHIEKNHELYQSRGEIAISSSVRKLLH
jgi:malonyl-CoA decarboxylase